MTAPKGHLTSEAADAALGQATQRLGDANMADKGMSIGDGTHGTGFGKHDAVYAVYRTKAADVNDVVIPHSLGRVPRVITLMSCEPTPQAALNSNVTVAFVNKSLWTESSFRASFFAGVGSIPDVILTFVVG